MLNDLNQYLKTSVTKAIEIGKELHEQKDALEHGQFVNWVENELPISRKTVDRYIKTYIHQNKMVNLATLQEAYEQIKQIEHKERRKQSGKDQQIINQRKKSGVKPEGWERRHDHLYKKHLEEEAYRERVRKHFKEKEEAKEEKTKATKEKVRENTEFINKFFTQEIEKETKRKAFRLNTKNENVNQEVMFERISDYINSVGEVSRQLEKAHNIIKFVKGIANELQQRTIA